jgi:hypothetical protein
MEMAGDGHRSSADWAIAERRSAPMAWLILAAGTVLCAIAAILS